MTPRSRGRWLVTSLLLVLAVAGSGSVVPPAAAADGTVVGLDGARAGSAGRAPATMRVTPGADANRVVRHVTVSWRGTKRKRTYSRSAVVPGIGRLTLTCRPNATYVRLTVSDRSAETQMWMAKYETKNNHAVVATKTARVYRYATAADDGTGGTGRTTTEGLNQRSRIENFSSGHVDGVISQRPGRNRPVAGTAPVPVTSLKLNWWWTGFRHPMSWRSCKMDAVLTTRLGTRMGVNWHGVADAPTTQHAEYDVPGLGTLRLSCEPDVGNDDGRRTLALVPAGRGKGSRAWVETVSGEGLVEDHVDGESVGYDPETGLVGPIDLPRNGMLRLFFQVGEVKRSLIASSYLLTNDRIRPELNVCETALALT